MLCAYAVVAPLQQEFWRVGWPGTPYRDKASSARFVDTMRPAENALAMWQNPLPCFRVGHIPGARARILRYNDVFCPLAIEQ